MRIFILDDSRSVAQAMADANLQPVGPEGEPHQYTLARPFRWDGEKIAQSLDDAIELVRNQPTFDVWVLDNDLGAGLEGYEFLKDAIALAPECVPPVVYSCSANPIARANIVAYAANWRKHCA